MTSFARRAIRIAVSLSLFVGPAAFAGTVYGDVVTEKGQPYSTKVSFIDETGRVVAEVAGLRLKRASYDVVQRATQERLSDSFIKSRRSTTASRSKVLSRA